MNDIEQLIYETRLSLDLFANEWQIRQNSKFTSHTLLKDKFWCLWEQCLAIKWELL